MLITYEDYTGLGYSAVSSAEFLRYEMQAASTVQKHTMGRVTYDTLHPTMSNDQATQNMYGICELIDYMQGEKTGSNRSISQFSNSKYSEQYTVYEKMVKTADEEIYSIISLHFGPGQLYSGIPVIV